MAKNAVRILVVGCGGTGCEVVDALARLHFAMKALGHPGGIAVTLCDPDTVSHNNIGRQRFIPADIGHNKAVVLAQRYNMGFGLNWEARPVALKPTRSNDFIETMMSYDIIVTCTDKAKFRWDFAKATPRLAQDEDSLEILWLDFGNGDSTGQAVLGHWAAAEGVFRLPNVADLFPSLKTVNDREEPSCSLAESLKRQQFGINRLVADAGLYFVLTPLLTKGEIANHGAFVDMRKGRVSPIPIDLKTWQLLNPKINFADE